MRVTDIFSFIFLNGNKIIYLFYNSVSSTISQWEAFNNEQTLLKQLLKGFTNFNQPVSKQTECYYDTLCMTIGGHASKWAPRQKLTYAGNIAIRN